MQESFICDFSFDGFLSSLISSIFHAVFLLCEMILSCQIEKASIFDSEHFTISLPKFVACDIIC